MFLFKEVKQVQNHFFGLELKKTTTRLGVKAKGYLSRQPLVLSYSIAGHYLLYSEVKNNFTLGYLLCVI